MNYPVISAQEAAAIIKNGYTVGVSGFTGSGVPKVILKEVAALARKEHEEGREFKINLYTGASTSDMLDGELARAKAVDIRTPYQSNKDMRNALNAGEMNYIDYHLSHLAQTMRYGFWGKVDVAIIEVCDILDNGDVIPGTGMGITPTVARLADKIILEYNHTIPAALRGFHDVYEPLDPPYRREIPIYKASDRAGEEVLHLDASKVIGVVHTEVLDGAAPFSAIDETTANIGANVCAFLAGELKAGRIPKEFLPLQSGVGNVANAVLAGLENDPNIPAFSMYTEVAQDSVFGLLDRGKCNFVSTCSICVSKDTVQHFYDNIEKYRGKVLVRPSELSNNPEVIRRLGIITMNTALEADIFGNINSTHVSGTKMMNGIGGSGDFTRNGYISIFSCPSVAKKGLISAIVPMVSHVDHSEHSVDVLITEQGIADLRMKSPIQRAKAIIENCAHPDYRPLLREYLKLNMSGCQTAHTLRSAFAFHQALAEHGDMHKVQF